MMKTARDYRCDISVLADEITPLPWSEFCESSDWWIASAAEDSGPMTSEDDPKSFVVCDANEMSTSDMLYTVWAANTAPELVKALEVAEARVRALEAGLAWYADEKHYDAYGAEISPADQDAGAIARAALTVREG